MTRTVKDAALMMNACAGPDDERDQYSLPAATVDYVKALKGNLKGLRVAWSEKLGVAPAVDPEVSAATAKAARAFRELGCKVESTEPTWPSPYDCWRTIFLGGIGARLAPYLDRRDQIDPGLFADRRGGHEDPADEVRPGVVRPARLVAARARLVRALRSLAHADGRLPGAPHRPVLPGRDRRA